MKSLRPPTVATWLLERFLLDPRDTSLIGDLIEHYTQGRSRAWYWRQVLIAIATGCWRDIRAHKLLAVRALAVGWTIILLERWLWPTVWGRLLSPLYQSGHFYFGSAHTQASAS